MFKQKTKDFVLLVASEKEFINLEKYVQMIEDKNKLINLTGFTGDKLWEEGIYESLITLFEVFKKPNGESLVDIGSGVGFPSVPFKIVFPNLNLTIIEPQKKRIIFLEEVSNYLNLNINFINSRSENVVKKTFDFITARAVASLGILLEISYHLGNINSKFCFLKGPSIYDEINKNKILIEKFKIKYSIIKISNLYLNRNLNCFYFEKIQKTPNGYPRIWTKIKEKKY